MTKTIVEKIKDWVMINADNQKLKKNTKWFKYTSTSWGLVNVNFPLGAKKKASTSWHPILHRHTLLRHADKLFILKLNFCRVESEKNGT